MNKIAIFLLTVICLLSAEPLSTQTQNPGPSAQTQTNRSFADQTRAVAITIATVGQMLAPPTSRVKPGEQVVVTITMTNTSSQPLYACISSDLYQNLPSLSRNGKALPFAKWQSLDLKNAQSDHTCQHEN